VPEDDHRVHLQGVDGDKVSAILEAWFNLRKHFVDFSIACLRRRDGSNWGFYRSVLLW